MGAVAAAPAFDALAFAFAALAFALVAYTLIINPLRSGADASSGLPVIGGALAWALSNLANLIESAVYYVDSLKDNAYRDATSWWNWLVSNTIGNYYGDVNGKFADLYGRTDSLWNQVYGVVSSQVADLYSQVSGLWNLSYGLRDELNSVIYGDLPAMRLQLSALASRAATLESDVYNIRAIILAALTARVGMLEADVNDVQRWRQWIGDQVLPRMQQDINVRAFESEAEWLRQQLQQAQNQLSLLLPLALLAVAGDVAIENLRCHMDVPCDPLAALAQADIIDRLDSLEIGDA